MQVEIDPNVQAVADYMQQHVPATKLVGVANRLAEVAGLLWGHHEPEDVSAMRLIRSDPSALNLLRPNAT